MKVFKRAAVIIGALRKIMALLGEKCHAYKLKKVGRCSKVTEILE